MSTSPDKSTTQSSGDRKHELYERLVMDQADAICALDLDDRVLFVNQAAAELLGQPARDLVGRAQQEVFGSKVYAETQKQLEERMSGRSSTYEIGMWDPQGKERTLLVTGNPLKDAEGKVVGSFGVLKDITARKLREQALETRLLLEQAISSATRSFVKSWDFHKTLDQALSSISLLLNATCSRLYEKSETSYTCTHQWSISPDVKDVRGRPFSIEKFPWWQRKLDQHEALLVMNRDELPPEADNERDTMEALGMDAMLALPIHFSGSLKGFLVFENLAPFGQLREQDLSIFQVFAEVLAATLARRKADEDRGLLFAAVEQSDMAVVISNKDHSVRYVNPAFERLFGYSRSFMLGKDPSILRDSEVDSSHFQEIRDTVARGEVWKGEVRYRTKGGTHVPADLTLNPVLNKEGAVEQVVGLIRDLSEFRKLESQLRQSQTLEAVGRLAAGLAHEINTPMQYIGDNTHFLKDSVGDILKAIKLTSSAFNELSSEMSPPPSTVAAASKELEALELEELESEVLEAAAQSLEGIDRVTKIIQSIKEFSYPAGREHTRININHCIKSTATVSRNEWKHCANLELDLDPGNPKLDGYPSEINQALLNLLVNAAQAIKSQGRESMGCITIRSRSDDSTVRIELVDDGPGIQEKNQPHVFEPFFTTKDVGKGTGQGLALVHRVVTELHCGEIELQSEPGCTRFIIELPKSIKD